MYLNSEHGNYWHVTMLSNCSTKRKSSKCIANVWICSCSFRFSFIIFQIKCEILQLYDICMRLQHSDAKKAPHFHIVRAKMLAKRHFLLNEKGARLNWQLSEKTF